MSENTTLSLAMQLCGAGESELLEVLSGAMEDLLRRRLAPGFSREDCGDVFPAAAALLTAGELREAGLAAALPEKFTVGSFSVSLGGGGEQAGAGSLRKLAWALMRPWTGDGSFYCAGTRG